MPYGTRAPKELLHHLPTLILRRPSVSADPTWKLSGVRGSRLLDRRPPHYRCPAVPGLKTSTRAILMALDSSVSSLWDQSLTYRWYCSPAYCSVACDSATLRQPAPSPVLRLLWLRTPLPNLPVRASAADAFTEVLLTDFTAGYCELRLRVLRELVLLTAAPDHCGPPGPIVSPVAVLQQPWLRNSTTAPSCKLQLRVLPPGSSCLPGPAVSLGYERNHNHTTTQCLLQPT